MREAAPRRHLAVGAGRDKPRTNADQRVVNEAWRKFPGRAAHRGGGVESRRHVPGGKKKKKLNAIILKGNNGNAALGLIILIAKHSY